MPASKRARKVRTAEEFDVQRLIATLYPPDKYQDVYSWELSSIRDARDSQMTGRFQLPARMSESMRTDDALFVAQQNRLAPLKALASTLVPSSSTKGDTVASEADGLWGPAGIGLSPGFVTDIHLCLADHGLAVAVNEARPRDDGSRVDYHTKPWPIEFVRWDPLQRTLVTRVEEVPDGEARAALDRGFRPSMLEVPITHGDGRWVVFAYNDINPWRFGCILPACMVWARHAFAGRDFSKGSKAHGDAKVLGTLPEGVDLNGPEAVAFMTLLRALYDSDYPYGIKPFGSEVTFVNNASTAWQVWKEIMLSAEKAAARIYQGTDATLGAGGGAPGIDIEQLFGVSATIVQGDAAVLTRGITTGIIEPWAAVNFGDSRVAPVRRWMIPDGDREAVVAAFAVRLRAFNESLASLRTNGIQITQDVVDELASRFDVPAFRLVA